MKSLWNESEASNFTDELSLRVYSSRLLGKDKSLVLHGGGNTSVKITEKNIFGEDEALIYVKGSGWDLETIEKAGFSPVNLDYLIRLAGLAKLSDPDMVNELRTHMKDAGAPTPSVEAILHATLPYKYVDHTHADAIVTITNTENGKQKILDIYGDSVVIIDYVMPGFDLARKCAEQFAREANEKTEGMVLMNHGIFSFGNNARESYERMISLVDRAEKYLQNKKAWDYVVKTEVASSIDISPLIQMRKNISNEMGSAVVLISNQSAKAMGFAQRSDVKRIASLGPATPDHVIRTKRIPMIDQSLEEYSANYADYFREHNSQSLEEKTMLDPAPRVILDNQYGVISVGRSAKDAKIIQDIYDHTIDVISRAELLGGYQALPSKHIFDVEYWDLEQAKLKKAGASPEFAGEVALITGANSGIGKACVDAMLSRGAAVIALDINPEVETLYRRPDFVGLTCDITDTNAVKRSLEKGILSFGGIDMLVLNAGMFPGGEAIETLALEQWRKVMQVNLDANLIVLQQAFAALHAAPIAGRVVVVGSKNVPAPGPGASAYSSSKAALTQLARVTALEWAKYGIRVNMVHPDAVFDTAIWSEDVLNARAKHYGMSVQEYKTKNLLKTEILSADVAALICALCGKLFSKTTAAQIPIDGGNDRVI